MINGRAELSAVLKVTPSQPAHGPPSQQHESSIEGAFFTLWSLTLSHCSCCYVLLVLAWTLKGVHGMVWGASSLKGHPVE